MKSILRFKIKTAILIFFLVNTFYGVVYAGEKNNEKTILLTKDSFKNIADRLSKDDPLIIALDAQFTLTEKELNGLYDTIKNNTELGHISWHKDQSMGYKVFRQIDAKLIDNNKNYRDHPNDYIHGLLSKHVYNDVDEDMCVLLGSEFDSYLKDWRVAKIFDDTTNSGYYGAIYINDKIHQLVLANRGSCAPIEGLVSKNGDWKTNFEEILGGQILVGQQAWNYQATFSAVKLAKKTGYRLSITGHSLGAWLAELSLFYCHAYFDYSNIKAVTFDSPGSEPMMKKLQSNIQSKHTQVDLDALEIITYLVMPNPINCCNKHVGTVYRINPKMKLIDWIKDNVPNFIKNLAGEDKIKGVLAVEGHFLDGILKTFDPITGKPKNYIRMADWPTIKYTGDSKDFSDRGKESIKKWFCKADELCLTKTVLDYTVSDTTIMSMVGLLKSLSDINQEQYWEYFSHIDLEEENKKNVDLEKPINFDNRFSLITKAKYREEIGDVYILDLKKGSVDEYLYELDKINIELDRINDLSQRLKIQLKDIASSFNIQSVGGNKYYLMPNLGHNVESIRQKMQGLLYVTPKNILGIFQTVIHQNTMAFTITGDTVIEFKSQEIKKLAENLPLEPTFYIRRKNSEEKLKKKLATEHIVIISGAEGVGKTSLAIKYGNDCKREKNQQVRWLRGTQIEEEFLQLAKEMHINIEEGFMAEAMKNFLIINKYYSFLIM